MFCCLTGNKPEGKKQKTEQPLPSAVNKKQQSAQFVKEIIPLSLPPQINFTFGKDMVWTANLSQEGRTQRKEADLSVLKQKMQKLQAERVDLIEKEKKLSSEIQRKTREFEETKSQMAKNSALCKVLEYMVSKQKLQIYQYEDRIKGQ